MIHLETMTEMPVDNSLHASLAAAEEGYTWLFWRPYLTAVPFDLWRVLLAFQEETRRTREPWPPITAVTEAMAIGDRYTILGRAATRTRPGQVGALTRLADEGLVLYAVRGEGKAHRYEFHARSSLPLLAPAQVATLSEPLQRAHDDWVTRRGLSAEWRAVRVSSLLRGTP
jgi:hypothetical protein